MKKVLTYRSNARIKAANEDVTKLAKEKGSNVTLFLYGCLILIS